MAKHSKHVPTLASLSIRQWCKLIAILIAVALFITVSVTFLANYHQTIEAAPITEYSVTDSLEVSRSTDRDYPQGSSANTQYVTVNINGQSRVVVGDDFTDVKSVLDAGNIVLESDDTVDPALTEMITEATIITIAKANTYVETTEESIAYNTIRKETSSLPAGTEKVEIQGVEGIMQVTSLVTRVNDEVVSSQTFTSYVKQAAVDEVILVGTGSTASSTVSVSIGTTVPTSDMQQWAHDYLLANGYTEEDFTATVYIISRESGWRVNASNSSSGAYGLPQALPGSKMASAGADWATNYQTQLKWFWNYCTRRYGSIQGAYAFWLANHWY